jgi:hypothetical protein
MAHVVIVDGTTYEFAHISIRKLNRVAIKLLSLLAAVELTEEDLKAFTGKTGQKEPSDFVEGGITGAQSFLLSKIMKQLIKQVDCDMVDEIVDILLSSCICVGKGIVSDKFDTVFGMNVIHLWKVVTEAVKYYILPFLSNGGDLQSLLQSVKESK